MHLLFTLIFLVFQTDIPLKPTEDFEIKLDYQIKQRPVVESYNANGNRSSPSGILPYLILNLKILKASEGEVKFRISSNLNNNVMTKRITLGEVYALDLGFTEDVKDKVTAHQYTILFLSAKKDLLSKISIEVTEDGTFFVNGEKRGKF